VVYEARGDLPNALKRYNDSLFVFEKLAGQEHMEMVKRNIERVSQQMKSSTKSRTIDYEKAMTDDE